MGAEIARASTETIGRAAALLRTGRIVAFPTETVYGLGGDATNERAVAEIFAAKGRPRINPLIVHVPGLAEAEALVVFNPPARRAAARFWPGPLSLVLPRRGDSRLSLLASAGLDTVAIRAPAHPVAQALLCETGRPIAAPSANRSGRVSPTEAAHVAEELGEDVVLILDGGPTQVGLGHPRAADGVIGPDRRAQIGPREITGHAGESLRTVTARPPRSNRSPPRRSAARLWPQRPSRLRRGPLAEPFRRSGGGSGQSVRDAAPSRPALFHRHRRHADPRARPRPRDQ